MLFGAIAGCIVAGMAMYATRSQPGEIITAPHPARRGPAVH
jgi:hypothetical protein